MPATLVGMTSTVTRESTWVSIAAAADQLGVHPRTLRRYIRDGRLTVLRLSTQVVRIRPEDLARFKEENIRIETGTGTCYVPDTGEYDEQPKAKRPRKQVTPGRPATFTG